MLRENEYRIRWLVVASSAVATTVALVVVVAWYAGWARVIQPLPDTGFMAFNTAISILFLGAACILLSEGYRRAALWVILPPAILAVGTIAEYLFEANLGLDEFFVRAFLTHPTAAPGRTAPNTSVAILLGSIVVVQYALFERRMRPLVLAQMLVVAMLTSSICAMVGHAMGLEPLPGWYGLTHMAPHTAFCLALISISLLILGRSRLQLLVRDMRQHVAALALSAGLVTSVAVWQMVQAEQLMKWERLVSTETHELAGRVQSSWVDQLKALDRHVRRWDYQMELEEDAWRHDARAYIRDFESLLALAYCTGDTTVGWIETAPTTTPQFLLPIINSDEARQTMVAARTLGKSQLSTSFTLNAQRRYVIGVTVATAGDQSSFVYVFDVEHVIERAISDLELDEFQLRVLEGDTLIYSSHRKSTPVVELLRNESTVALAGLVWQIEATPTKDHFDRTQSDLALAILVLGSLATITLAWSLRERGIAYRLASVNAETTEELTREIRARERVQTALSNREEHIRTLLQSTSEAIFGVDLKGNCTFVNNACVEVLGFGSEDAMLGQNMHMLIHHSRADGSPLSYDDCAISRSFRESVGVHSDAEVFWRADGTKFPVEYSAHPILSQGETKGAVIAFADITLRKRNAEALRASEERFDLAVRGASDGLWDWDIETGYVWYSPRYLELLGYLEETAFPANLDSFVGLIHPDDRAMVAESLRKHLEEYEVYDVELRLLTRSGSYLYFRSRGSCIRAADGKPYRMAGAVQDVTKHREMLQELNRLNHNLKIRTQELEQRNQEVEAFVYIVSHDLRAPLVNIQGFCSELEYSCKDLDGLLQNATMPPVAAEQINRVIRDDMPSALRFITAGTNRFESLINALLRLSRTGRQTYTFEKTDMGALLNRIVESLAMNIENAGATITIGTLPDGLVDKSTMEQVFSNLIVNALAYLRHGVPGSIEIGGHVNDESGNLHYWIRDNGMGIPEGAREKVFQVFQRAHPTCSEGEGMGLAIVKRIVERHGGEIWVESQVDVGTTFHFTLDADPSDLSGSWNEEMIHHE